MKKAFLLKNNWIEIFNNLSDKQAGVLIKTLFKYNVNGEKPDNLSDIEVKAYFNMMLLGCDEIKNKNNGIYHWNWKGGITSNIRSIRNSSEMKHWIKSVYKRDNYTCQLCNIRGGKLNAHHIKKFSKYPELRFDIDNGITLCRECHINIHKKRNDKI